MKIAFLTTELAPLTNIGALGTTSSDLPAALARRGHDVTVWLPAYTTVLDSDRPFRDLTFMRPLQIPVGHSREAISLMEWRNRSGGYRVLIVDHPASFRRPGIYHDPKTGEDYPDNDRRWIVFQRGVLEGMKAMDLRPDVLHLNDYQTGLVPTYLKTAYRDDRFFHAPPTLFSIHNLGFQGIYPAEVLNMAGLSMDLFYPTGPLEFWGRVNFMKSGIIFSDFLTTSSPTYAREIQASEEYGLGLEGVLKSRASELRGIPNGIDTNEWDPALDPHLPARYSPADPGGKSACRRALLDRVGLRNGSDAPLLVIPGATVDHRAADLLSEASAEILANGYRILAIGAASEHWRDLARELEVRHRGEVAFLPEFDRPFLHLAEAGGDFSLTASRHETWCAGPLVSQRYGTLPIVREAGCTADAVRPYDAATGEGTGFSFRDYNPEGLLSTLKVAATVFRDPDRLRTLRGRAMAKNPSWDQTAAAYEEIYLSLVDRQNKTSH